MSGASELHGGLCWGQPKALSEWKEMKWDNECEETRERDISKMTAMTFINVKEISGKVYVV